MTRDNLLYLFCGAVLGLIAGSLFIGPLVADAKRNAAQAKIEAPTAPESRKAAATAGDSAVMQQVMQEIATLRARLESNPDDVDAMVRLGNLYMDAHKFDNAIEYFESALKRSANPDVETDLGLCYRGQGNVDRALNQFRKVRTEHPDHFAARFNEAVVLFVDLKRPAEAREIITQLKKERPDDPAVLKFEQALASVPS